MMSRTRTFFPLLLTSLCAAALGGAASAGGGHVPFAGMSILAPAPATVPSRASAGPAPLIVTPRVPALPAGSQTTPVRVSPTATMTVPVAVPGAAARATLRSADGISRGEVLLNALPSGELSVRVQAGGLTPGQHGMHVHTVGQCSDKVVDGKPSTFGAAEGHFDPAATGNHAAPDVPTDMAHAGDLPMLVASMDGSGSADFTTRKFSLDGANSVVGRSLIIHAGADDYQTDPSGNSGARVLCGVIEPVTGN